MVTVFVWDDLIQEYVCIHDRGPREFLQNLMADPVWSEADFVYFAW